MTVKHINRWSFGGNVDGKGKQLVHFYFSVSLAFTQSQRIWHKYRRYLNKRGQQNTAHLLLQNDLVLKVAVTSGDKWREEHFGQPWVTEILEGQLTELLQYRGVAAGLHDDLRQGGAQVSCRGALACPASRFLSPQCPQESRKTCWGSVRRKGKYS